MMIGLGVLALVSVVGCSTAADPAVQWPRDARSSPASVGDDVDVGGDLRVTLVGIDETVPPEAMEASPATNPHWIQFEVINTGESSASLPGRPIRPTLVDSSGQSLDVQGSRVRLVDGGGGWGPAAAGSGGPYLNPGGSMVAWFEVPALDRARGPLVIEYAPTKGSPARYQIP